MKYIKINGKQTKVIASLPFRHPEDNNLVLILCKYESKFVVWNYTLDLKSASSGSYLDSYEKAFDVFLRRASSLMPHKLKIKV